MDNKILELKEKFVSELEKIDNLADIENIRVSYLGKKGSVTDLLKGMKELSNDERKVFGQKVNELKGLVNEKITEKTQELKEKEIQKEIELMPEFDLSMPPVMDRGSYHPITLVQRECERRNPYVDALCQFSNAGGWLWHQSVAACNVCHGYLCG